MSQTNGPQTPRVYVSGFVSGCDIRIEVSLETYKRFEEVRHKLNYGPGILLTAIVEVIPAPRIPDELWLSRGLGFLEVEHSLHAVRLEGRPKRERFQQAQK